MSSTIWSTRSTLSVVATKLTAPVSPPTPMRTPVPSSWSALEMSSPLLVDVPSLSMAPANSPTPGFVAGSY